MLAENLVMLRNIKGLSQEEIAEAIGVSRQAYAKWEQGKTIPDVEKCDVLARFYGTSVDALLHQNEAVGAQKLPPAPAGKHIWGTVTLGEKGQILLPKAARDTFLLGEGDCLVVLGDEAEGIALVKAEDFEAKMRQGLRLAGRSEGKEREEP